MKKTVAELCNSYWNGIEKGEEKKILSDAEKSIGYKIVLKLVNKFDFDIQFKINIHSIFHEQGVMEQISTYFITVKIFG